MSHHVRNASLSSILSQKTPRGPPTESQLESREAKYWKRKGVRMVSKSQNRRQSSQSGFQCQLFYLSGSIQYEGLIRDRLKHGLGKEYYEIGTLKYQGLFVEDMYNDHQGISYFKNGKIQYKGSFVNGIRSGKGKEYARNGNVIYDGYWINNEKVGKRARLYYPNGKLEYDGDIEKNLKHGKGKEYCVTGE